MSKANGSIEHIGTTLRRVRRQREDSQEQIGILLGMSQPNLSKVERGVLDPPRGSWSALARYLSEPDQRVTVADVQRQVETHALQARERELVAELATVREQLATRVAQAS